MGAYQSYQPSAAATYTWYSWPKQKNLLGIVKGTRISGRGQVLKKKKERNKHGNQVVKYYLDYD